MFRDEVVMRYSDELTDLDRAEFEDLVDRESQRLNQEMVELQPDLEESAVRAWTQAHGRKPADLEMAGVLNTARMQAAEIVRARLWEGFPQSDPQTDSSSEPAGDNVPAMQRWNGENPVPASPEAEQIVELLWPGKPMEWVVTAELLIQARLTDRLEVPRDPLATLTAELATLVDADVAHDRAVRAHARSLNSK